MGKAIQDDRNSFGSVSNFWYWFINKYSCLKESNLEEIEYLKAKDNCIMVQKYKKGFLSSH